MSAPSLFTIDNDSGFRVAVLDLGAAIHSIELPVPGRRPLNVALNYAHLDDYLDDHYYMGSTVGRYANRIANARYTLDGTTFELDANEGESGNCLHGGANGLHRQFWSVERGADHSRIDFRHLSPAGSQGFPGNLDVAVSYAIVDSYSLAIDYVATSDAQTVLNLANHAYFNLDGGDNSIDGHALQLPATMYTPVSASKIPSGSIAPVTGTQYDFTRPRHLHDGVSGVGRVLDTNFVLSDSGGELREAATLYSPASGIRLVVHTTQPGLQVYTGDGLGEPFCPRQGICLEAQNFPDAPNEPRFPSAVLRPGDTYRQRTILEFFVT